MQSKPPTNFDVQLLRLLVEHQIALSTLYQAITTIATRTKDHETREIIDEVGDHIDTASDALDKIIAIYEG